MNTIDDLDRVLADWLADGPSRAPDRPLAVALEHARSHPRRRDPFAFLRNDAFGGRTSAFALQPGWALLAVALLIAALIAIGVGSRRDAAPIVPGPTASPTPGPSATSAPSNSPTTAVFHVVLPDSSGYTLTLDILDESRTLVAAGAGQPPESADVIPPGGIGVFNDPANGSLLRLSWIDGPCTSSPGVPASHAETLTIDPSARSFNLVDAGPCPGGAETIGIERDLVLTFAAPLPAATVHAMRGGVPPSASPGP